MYSFGRSDGACIEWVIYFYQKIVPTELDGSYSRMFAYGGFQSVGLMPLVEKRISIYLIL
ncbi:MAG: hypothetical protein IPP77_06610 [Bacteroidetes bacterium]|nr:hypothetical protein [Bacteroidota bacterium]